MATVTVANEHRNRKRHRALKRGLIVFHNGTSTIDCIVHELSDAGARLECEGLIGIPESFILRIADGSRPRPCVVRWHTGHTIGVEFTP
jgi:hypothetical protein